MRSGRGALKLSEQTIVRLFLSKAIKFLIGLLLLPILPPLVFAIWHESRGLQERTLVMVNPLSLCLGGIVAWGIFALLFRLPPRVYIFAHELTHALFVKLCGGQVKRISVGKESGYVLSDRSNFLIVLAPYLFPFYATALGFCAAIAALAFPLGGWEIPLWLGLGICLGYHWSLTGRMLTTRQNDFSSQGYFFSFVLILVINLLLMLLIFLLLPAPRDFSRKLLDLAASIGGFYGETFAFMKRCLP